MQATLLFLATLILASSTDDLRRYAEEQSKDMKASLAIAKASADAAQRAAKATEDTVVAMQRPWVSVDLTVGSPIIYSPEEARVDIHFLFKNSGHSPAINVQVDAELALFMDNGKFPLDVMKEICKRAKSSPDDDAVMGHSIFPDGTFTYSINLGKRIAEIQDAFSNFRGIPKNEWFSPVVVGCVSYRFPFQKGRHTTEFIVELRKIDRSNPKTPGGFKLSDGNVPVSEIVLTRSFIGGNAD